MLIPLSPALRDPFRGRDDCAFLVSTSLSRGCQHSMAIMASASRAVQEPAALPIPVTGPGRGSAFTDRTHAKQRHGCATRHPMFWLYERVAKGAAVSIRFFMAAAGLVLAVPKDVVWCAP
jgi:hypothetical protein